MNTVDTDAPTVWTFRLKGSQTARLFGAPFLLIGVYLAYQLARGVLDLLAGRAALSEMLVGTVLVAVVAAAFLVPGWLLVLAESRVEIDRAAGTVTAVRDLRLHRMTERRPLSDFHHVAVGQLRVAERPSDRTRSSYQVELATADTRNNVVIGQFDDQGEARAFGRRVSDWTGLSTIESR